MVTNFRTVLIFVLSYFWKKYLVYMKFLFCFEILDFQSLFYFEAFESTKISSYEPVSSQKYENGYQTKISNFTVLVVDAMYQESVAVE